MYTPLKLFSATGMLCLLVSLTGVNAQSCEYLVGTILSKNIKLIPWTVASLVYSMLLAQHDLSEPQVRQALLRFQRRQYESLRAKMSLRILDSCYLFGVVDEDGVLGPDEVFINLPSRCGVLVRDVIVGRYVSNCSTKHR